MPKKVVKQPDAPAAQGRAAPSKAAAKVVAPAVEQESDDFDGSEGEYDDEDSEGGEDDVEEDSDDEFEKQSSSDEDSVDQEGSINGDHSDDDVGAGAQIPMSTRDAEKNASERKWSRLTVQRGRTLDAQRLLNIDDLSSDDDEVAENGNTIGRVPLHWYDAFDHIGYDVTGQKMQKRKGGDRIDAALANRDDPAASRTVYDMYNDRHVVLSEREMEIIRRVQAGAFAHPEYDDTPDYIDYESSILEVMPLSAQPEPKRRFVPSKWEMMKVMKIVKAIKEGRYKEGEKASEKPGDKPPVYLIWNDEEDEVIADSKRMQYHLPAPKMPLPGHAESYNPPAEYLLTEAEAAQMEEMDEKERPFNFAPKKHDCLRHVAGYDDFVKERFERCLDLYLCPRKLKRRLNIDPETLVPRLPSPSELKPYPNTLCLQYLGHRGAVRSVAISPDGQYLASGGADGTVRLWELDTSLCRYIWDLSATCGGSVSGVTHVAWNPDPAQAMLVAVAYKSVVLIATGTGDEDSTELTETQLAAVEALATSADTEVVAGEDSDEAGSDEEGAKKSGKKAQVHAWHLFSATDKEGKTPAAARRHGSLVGPRLELRMSAQVGHAAWHYKGDYLAVLAPDVSSGRSVSVHQLSKGKTQFPFSKSPGKVQALSFHPSRPFLFLVTQQHVKVYNLVEQRLVKRLVSGCKWLSSIDVHPSGDHVIVGSYDRRVVWFDLDLSSAPYKTLKFHEKAVRSLQFHK